MSYEAEVYYLEGCYCSLCDEIFATEEARAEHVQLSEVHPACDKCQRRFQDRNGLRTHYDLSNEHHYCPSCDAHFKSAAGLRAHREFSAAHGNVHNGVLSTDEDVVVEDWEEFMGNHFFPFENDEFELRKQREDLLNEEQEELWTEDYEFEHDEDEELYGQIMADKAASEQISGLSLTDCPLCCQPYDDQVSATKCGHVFCTSCIQVSLNTHSSCPVCDRPACRKTLRTLYLF